jgi:hypothetical protein
MFGIVGLLVLPTFSQRRYPDFVDEFVFHRVSLVTDYLDVGAHLVVLTVEFKET